VGTNVNQRNAPRMVAEWDKEVKVIQKEGFGGWEGKLMGR